MRGQHTVETLKRKYEHEIQAIENSMKDKERWGIAEYYAHRCSIYRQFVEELETIQREQEGGKNG